jgi:hypothetical protein
VIAALDVLSPSKMSLTAASAATCTHLRDAIVKFMASWTQNVFFTTLSSKSLVGTVSINKGGKDLFEEALKHAEHAQLPVYNKLCDIGLAFFKNFRSVCASDLRMDGSVWSLCLPPTVCIHSL